MTRNLKVTTIQTDLVWEDVSRNLEKFDDLLDKIEKTDLIVLPEMFSTGFSMDSVKLAEKPEGRTFKWLKKQSEKLNAAIVASVIIEDDNKFYNRLYWVNPDGTFYFYNKRHLFRMANEHNFYTAGSDELIVNYKGWRIKPLVCYDLRFPVWARNKNDYDALIYIANWPERRSEPWKVLLKARAIENLAYVVGVNRIGEDGNNVIFSGDTAVINAKGEVITRTCAHEEMVETVELDMEDLKKFRNNFPAHLDADKFDIR